jgi:hypothetical protein
LSELLVRKLYRWTRPCFSLHVLTERRSDFQVMLSNAPTLKPEPFLARFQRPERPQIQDKKAHHPLPRSADGVVNLEPFWERPAGPKHTRAEQDQS